MNVAMSRPPRSVGVRELKDSLSRYLRRVRAGETIVVTDRGRAVARLVPTEWTPGLVEMARSGELIPAERSRRRVLRPLPYRAGRKILSDIVIADRHR